ncbi:MAG: amidohydrolase family protein [Clostridia bacterium]|nr:amidohydrolase family protein [Clostridia bacterium]MBQ3650847.1 amidohydrolase family protein [Clostridia bacterium]MBQ6865522.1 amidohydrolase family protein [Clostridia bacterium]MBQ9923822.1 amidohydrolase family protein [Clostridia bacterium]MBR0422825.1 amidohydrolase family protein [Clostridia bacterium]
MEPSILIQGGHVIDPFQGIDQVRDVCCVGETMSVRPGENPVRVDATGCYVLPGLIDYHIHLFKGGDFFGISADRQLAYGVTTVLDAGSTGSLNFELLRKQVIDTADIRVKALLNVCAFGNPGGGYHEDLNAARFRVEDMARLLRRYPQTLLGLKIRISKEVMEDNGMADYRRAVEIARELGVPLVVHIPDPFDDIGAILDLLSAGDTVAHVYHGKGQTLLDENGKVRQAFQDARKRGVLFDVANACSNCDWRVAKRAIEEGFLPDIISTDLTMLGHAKPHMVKNLPFVLSKFMALGLDLKTVVAAATANPAKAMGMSGRIGTLQPGAAADVTIAELRQKPMLFTDKFGNSHTGDQVLVPVMTIHNGQFAYCSPDFN